MPPRRSPRLSFIGRPAPRLETDEFSYEIVDLSPGGLRFRAAPAAGPAVTIGAGLRAVIRFPTNTLVEVAGRVLRISGREAAVQLEERQDLLAAIAQMGSVSPPRTGMLW